MASKLDEREKMMADEQSVLSRARDLRWRADSPVCDGCKLLYPCGNLVAGVMIVDEWKRSLKAGCPVLSIITALEAAAKEGK